LPLAEEFELVSERLSLRLHDPGLAQATSDYYQRNRAHFAPYCPLREAAFHDVDAWRKRSAELKQASLSGQALHLLVFRRDQASSEVIGNVNFTHIVRGVFQAGYLGYQLDHEYVGQGLMQEALTAGIAHVFGKMNLHRLMANYVPNNERSAHLLRCLGFQVEGYARDYLFLEGQWKDHVLTSLNNPHFEAFA
jgi:ribosomal-protein-alanine N-acetyltransferase